MEVLQLAGIIFLFLSLLHPKVRISASETSNEMLWHVFVHQTGLRLSMGNGSSRAGSEIMKCRAIEGSEGKEARVRMLRVKNSRILQDYNMKPDQN